MFAFFDRSLPYKVGFIALMVSSGLFLLGFATPNWVAKTFSNAETYQGLWVDCVEETGKEKVCEYMGAHSNQMGWFHGTRALQTVGLMVLAAAWLYGFIVNCCCSKSRPVSKTLEILAIVGGVLAFSGAMVYVAYYHKRHDPNVSLSWSTYLASIGSAFTIAAGVLIAYSNVRHDNVVV